MALLKGSSDRIPVLGKTNRDSGSSRNSSNSRNSGSSRNSSNSRNSGSSRNSDGRVPGVHLSGNYNNWDADFDEPILGKTNSSRNNGSRGNSSGSRNAGYPTNSPSADGDYSRYYNTGDGGYDFGGLPEINVPKPDYSGLMEQFNKIMGSIDSIGFGNTPQGQGGGTSGPAAGAPGENQANADYLAAVDKAKEESARALQAGIEQGVGNINAQRDPLDAQYQKATQQAYIAKRKSEKNLAEQLAAQGLTGGATESANLALEAGYGNSLNDLTNTYNQGLAELDRSAANYQAAGEINLAQNASQFEQMKAQAAETARQQAVQIQAQKDMQAVQIEAQQNMAVYQAKISALQQAASLAAQMGMTEYNAQIQAQLTQYQVAAQQEMARFNAAKEAERQAVQQAAQFDMTKYQADISAAQKQSDRDWQAQQNALSQQWQKDFYNYQNQLDYDTWLKKEGVKGAAKSAVNARTQPIPDPPAPGGGPTASQVKDAFGSVVNRLGQIGQMFMPRDRSVEQAGSPYTVAQEAAMYQTPSGSVQYLQGLLNSGQISRAQYNAMVQNYL